MDTNPYDINEEKYSHVISLLKNLPKKEAPSNFEYNLKVRIENKNFKSKFDEEKAYRIPWRIVIPSFGTVAVIALIFFSSLFNQDPIENPFQMKPQLRSNYSSNSFDGYVKNAFGVSKKINENDVIIKLEQPKMAKNDELSTKSEINIPQYLLNEGRSTDLDKVINPHGVSRLSHRAALTRSSNSRFSGFYMYHEIDRAEFERLKARNDSIRNVLKKSKTTR